MSMISPAESSPATPATGRCFAPGFARANDPLGRQPGEYLWDDDYGYGSFLRGQEKEQPPRNWSALFQQARRPIAATTSRRSGCILPRAPTARDAMHVYGASDYAVTAKGGDYTVHVVIGVDTEERMYLLDLWRRQASSDVWIEAWCDLVLKWKPMGWAEEQGQIRAGVGPSWTSAPPSAGPMSHGRCFRRAATRRFEHNRFAAAWRSWVFTFPNRAPWLADLRAELLSFPAGRHDDHRRRPWIGGTTARPDGRRTTAEAEGRAAVRSLCPDVVP